ncbi:MAG: hypothetical protein CBC35_02315 [Planctomycetes bacterium TMED75]|nr:hypothetical protein [Planctomycetaceae bacterium]OUU95885.1 MAG: hypothetical protein CBC35_02315 [Planctomycetes bacterium TMED75]
MTTTITNILPEDMHRLCASSLFNRTWEALDRDDRTPEEDAAMLDMAHASLWHWRVVGAPINLSRGEWLVSRVSAVLGYPESALRHAQATLALCDQYQLSEFDRAFAHEAMARAYAVASDPKGITTHVQYGLAAAEHVKSASEQEWVRRSLGSVTTAPAQRDA